MYESLSSYLRDTALNRKLTKFLDLEFFSDLNRIGNNINQIAKHLNISKEVDKEILVMLKSIYRDIKKLNDH